MFLVEIRKYEDIEVNGENQNKLGQKYNDQKIKLGFLIKKGLEKSKSSQYVFLRQEEGGKVRAK